MTSQRVCFKAIVFKINELGIIDKRLFQGLLQGSFLQNEKFGVQEPLKFLKFMTLMESLRYFYRPIISSTRLFAISP